MIVVENDKNVIFQSCKFKFYTGIMCDPGVVYYINIYNTYMTCMYIIIRFNSNNKLQKKQKKKKSTSINMDFITSVVSISVPPPSEYLALCQLFDDEYHIMYILLVLHFIISGELLYKSYLLWIKIT